MCHDRLTRLAEAGVPVYQVTSAQRAVLLGLTEAEFGVLVAVMARIGSANSDVEGQDLVVMLLHEHHHLLLVRLSPVGR